MLGEKMDAEKLYDAVNLLLYFQVPDTLFFKSISLKFGPIKLSLSHRSLIILLKWQSKNGGLAVWEPARGNTWLEVMLRTYLFFFILFFCLEMCSSCSSLVLM